MPVSFDNSPPEGELLTLRDHNDIHGYRRQVTLAAAVGDEAPVDEVMVRAADTATTADQAALDTFIHEHHTSNSTWSVRSTPTSHD